MFRLRASAEQENPPDGAEPSWPHRLQWLGGVAAVLGLGIIAANESTLENTGVGAGGVVLFGLGVGAAFMGAFVEHFPAGGSTP